MTAPARFAVVGLSNSLLSFLTFRAGLELLPSGGGRAALAQAFAYSAGTLWSYGWNRGWTFGVRGPLLRTLAAFAAAQALLLAASAAAIGVAVDVLGGPPTPVWISVMALATVLNYLAQRHLIFVGR